MRLPDPSASPTRTAWRGRAGSARTANAPSLATCMKSPVPGGQPAPTTAAPGTPSQSERAASGSPGQQRPPLTPPLAGRRHRHHRQSGGIRPRPRTTKSRFVRSRPPPIRRRPSPRPMHRRSRWCPPARLPAVPTTVFGDGDFPDPSGLARRTGRAGPAHAGENRRWRPADDRSPATGRPRHGAGEDRAGRVRHDANRYHRREPRNPAGAAAGSAATAPHAG